MEDTGYDSPVEQFPLQAPAHEVQYAPTVQHPVAQITGNTAGWHAIRLQAAIYNTPAAG